MSKPLSAERLAELRVLFDRAPLVSVGREMLDEIERLVALRERLAGYEHAAWEDERLASIYRAVRMDTTSPYPEGSTLDDEWRARQLRIHGVRLDVPREGPKDQDDE